MDAPLIEEYIAKYGKSLTGLCMKLCKNVSNGEDLFQDTWHNAIRYYKTWDQSRPFDKWLYSICFNTYKHMCKKYNKMNLQHFSDDDEKAGAMNNIPAASSSPDDMITLWHIVDNLPEAYKRVVVIFYYEDMTIEDTAEIMGIPKGTVKSRLFKAREMIRERLG